MEKFNRDNLKVGDKVLLKNERGSTWNDEGKMDKYKGKIVTISKLDGPGFRIEEDDRGNNIYWNFSFDDIERVANDITLSDLQFADILTLKNGERFVVADGYMYGEESWCDCDCNELKDCYNDDLTQNDDDDSEYDIVKVERAGQVIYEREEIVEMTIPELEKKLGIKDLRIK